MGMPEFVTVQCDETGRFIAANNKETNYRADAKLYINHSEALDDARYHGWFVTATETLSPQGWSERYERVS